MADKPLEASLLPEVILLIPLNFDEIKAWGLLNTFK